MLDQLREGEVVTVWKLDRLARSTHNLLKIVETDPLCWRSQPSATSLPLPPLRLEPVPDRDRHPQKISAFSNAQETASRYYFGHTTCPIY
jgi:hypothetical protein